MEQVNSVSSSGKFLRSGDNIKAILQSFATEFSINPLLLDYNLVGYQSFILKDSGEEVAIDNSEINSYIETNNTIIQKYEVEIFRRESSFYPILIQVQTNDNALELRANIYTNRIPQLGKLEDIIYQTIINICAYRGIIINLSWQGIERKITEIAERLRSNDAKPEFYTIDICRLKEPMIESVAVRLLISKNQKNAILSHDSLLLSGGFFSVKKGEVLLSYKKPRYTAPWRNIYGNLYGVGLSYPIGIEAGDGIALAQRDDKILYVANEDGYVSVVNGVMMISQSIIVDNINAKNIQNIKEQGIKSLVVRNDALLKDVIPSGFNLNVDDLKIVGNIGAVEIESKNLFINGQVHIKSNLKAKTAQILHLKGRLQAEDAEIRHCENAEIECEDLSINYLNGSKIYFSTARISHIQSNNLLFVQKSLFIKNMIGENNEFIMYPCLYGVSKANLEKIYDKLFYIKKLHNLILQDKNDIYSLKNTSDLIYENLSAKNAYNLHNWKETLKAYERRAEGANAVFNHYMELLEGLALKENEIKAEIRAKQEEMFNIEVVFEEKSRVGFFVRFVNFYGIENRYFIGASDNNQVKRVLLARGDKADDIKIVCQRD